MAFFEWKDSYCVGIKKIDEQHKHLVEMIDNFFSAMSAGQASSLLAELLNDLVQYTIVHFKTEEELMEKYQYSLIISHKFKHSELTKKVKEYQNQVNAGNMHVAIELSKFLKDWLADHILKTDQEYSVFFKEKGVN